MELTKRRPGRIAKFTLKNVKNGPIKAKGYPNKYPYQYANYWNKKNQDNEVEVVFDKKGNPWFQSKMRQD